MSTTSTEHTRQESIEKLRDLMKGIKFCMLTTPNGDRLQSRPMTLQDTEFDGDLWFLTGKDTAIADQIRRDGRLNASFSNPSDNVFVSVSGRGSLLDDRAKIKQYWTPAYRAWFPKGADDPNIVLLRVDIDSAEYWDAPGGIVTYLTGLVKAMATGKQANPAEHEKLEMR